MDELLRAVKAAWRGFQEQFRRELEVHGVHPGQQYILIALTREDNLPVGVLAERLEVEGPTVVRAVQRLEAAGIVERVPDPADRRRALVRLTARGRRLEPAVVGAMTAIEERAVHGLSERDRQKLLDLLGRVTANLRRE